MNAVFRIRKIIYLFLSVFFACFSLQSLSQSKTLVFISDSTDAVTIDQNYFQIQADGLYLKAEMAYYNNQAAKAIDYLKEALLQDPHSIHFRTRLADIYREEKLFAEASLQYKFLIQNTGHPEFSYKLAEIYSLRGLNKAAMQLYGKSHFQKARLLMENQQWNRALKFLNSSLKQTETLLDKAEILLLKAYIYERQSNKLKAKQVFQNLLNLNVTNESFILKASQFYTESKQWKRAQSLLLSYQQKEEASVRVAKALFMLFLSLDQMDLVYKQFLLLEKLAALEDTHYLFITSFLISKNRYQEAIPFLKDLKYKHPDKGYYRYLLGFVYEENRDWKAALKEYESLSKSSGYFTRAQMQIGQIWKKQGNSQKALKILRKASLPLKNLKDPKILLVYAQYLWEEGEAQNAILVLKKASNVFITNTDILFLKAFYLKQLGEAQESLQIMEQVLKFNPAHGEALNFIAYTYAENQHNLDQAEQLAKQAISLKPNSGYFLDTLGWVLFQKQKYQKALFYFNEALSYNQKDSVLMRHLGETYYKLKNNKKSKYFFKQALKLENNEQNRLYIQTQLASLP